MTAQARPPPASNLLPLSFERPAPHLARMSSFWRLRPTPRCCSSSCGGAPAHPAVIAMRSFCVSVLICLPAGLLAAGSSDPRAVATEVDRLLNERYQLLGPEREPVCPDVLDLLCDGFVRSGHDLKWLLATVANTQAYQRSARAEVSGAEPPFAAATPTRLRADHVYAAIAQALGEPNPPRRRTGRPSMTPIRPESTLRKSAANRRRPHSAPRHYSAELPGAGRTVLRQPRSVAVFSPRGVNGRDCGSTTEALRAGCSRRTRSLYLEKCRGPSRR